MTLRYEYTEDVFIEISLKDDQISPNYIRIVFSKELAVFLEQLDADTSVGNLSAEIEFQDGIRRRINDFLEIIAKLSIFRRDEA